MTDSATPDLLAGHASDSRLSDDMGAPAMPTVPSDADSLSSSEPALHQTFEISNETTVSTISSDNSDADAFADKPSFTSDLVPQREDDEEEPRLDDVDERSPSYENLCQKESKNVEEKDVDEREDEQRYIDLPEKGAHEDQKEFKRDDQSSPEVETTEAVEEEATPTASAAPAGVRKAASFDLDIKVKWHPALSPPKLVTTQFAPIDVTFESGLDLIGQEPNVAGSLESGHDSLERSQSYDVHEGQHCIASSGARSRHYSSPEDVLCALGDDAQEDKGTCLLRPLLTSFLVTPPPQSLPAYPVPIFFCTPLHSCQFPSTNLVPNFVMLFNCSFA